MREYSWALVFEYERLMCAVYVDEYEGPRERASRVTRPGEMKQKCN